MDLEEHGVLSNKPTGVKGVPSDVIDERCNWSRPAVVSKNESCSCSLNFLYSVHHSCCVGVPDFRGIF